MNTAFTKDSQTNSNTTVAPMHGNLEQYIEEVITFRLGNVLLYQVQCLTIREAAVLLSVDEGTVRDWITAGKLKAAKVGHAWIIRVYDIDKMLSTHSNVISIDDKRFKKNRKAD